MNENLPTTTVVSCAKCGTPVRLKEGDSEGRCEACNSLVARNARSPATRGGSPGVLQPVALAGAFLIFAAGVGAWAFGRTATPPAVLPEAPQPRRGVVLPSAPASEPVGELAWVPEARGPLLTPGGGGVENIFGFFRVWNGRSAWTSFAGAFSGQDLKPLWRSEPLDPWLVRRAGIVPEAVLVGKRIVVADATATLRVYLLASGEKDATYQLSAAPTELCKPPDPSAKVWLALSDAKDVAIDLDTGKSLPQARPAFCPTALRAVLPSPRASRQAGRDDGSAAPVCQDEFRNLFGHASCAPAPRSPAGKAIEASYVLRDGDLSVVLGVDSESPHVPAAFGYGTSGTVAWQKALPLDATTKTREEVPGMAEVSGGVFYVVYDKLYFDSRLAAFDAKTGESLWDVPVPGSLPRPGSSDGGRGAVRGIVASGSRVYVTRAGGALDIFEAKNGATVGTLGNQKM